MATPIFNALLPLLNGSSDLTTSVNFRLNFAIYVHVGALSVMIWDIIHNLKGDYQLIVSRKSWMRTAIYFVSRIFTLAYVLGRTLYLTLPMSSCGPFHSFLTASYIILTSTTTLLAYLHLNSLFSHHPLILYTFGMSWVAVVGGSLTLVPGIRRVTFYAYCTEAVEKQYTAATFITALVYHVLLFAVVVFTSRASKAALREKDDSKDGPLTFQVPIHERCRSVRQRRSLAAPEEGISGETQCCYFTAQVASLVATIWFFSSSHTSAPSPRTNPFRLTMLVFYAVVANITLCRVYRSTTLGPLSGQNATSGAPSIRTGHGPGMSRMASANQLAIGMGTKEREGVEPGEGERHLTVDVSMGPGTERRDKVVELQTDFEDDTKGMNLNGAQRRSGEVFTVRMV